MFYISNTWSNSGIAVKARRFGELTHQVPITQGSSQAEAAVGRQAEKKKKQPAQQASREEKEAASTAGKPRRRRRRRRSSQQGAGKPQAGQEEEADMQTAGACDVNVAVGEFDNLETVQFDRSD
ncbi:hypothetical protein Ccrd_018437 [Cynara cardunculus var. scolymus]|uniref:Uncharacterized protein n=1 Tax=Cynara cardunculus var. scolymus TaxID=59895 RepID=A0A103Y684_CYNCS|nr:hypothetical protein Ccrd_018437 [Cynara cardunculus var. scolymus]